MLSDFKKSLYSFFNERIANPFYGALIIAWCFWNWEIIYITLFIDKGLVGNKIDYIKLHYWDFKNLVNRPIVSALALVFLFPIFNIAVTAAQSAFHRANVWVRDWILKPMRLTSAQSVALIEQNKALEKRFSDGMAEKDNIIDELNKDLSKQRLEISTLHNQRENLEKDVSQLRVSREELVEKERGLREKNNEQQHEIKILNDNEAWMVDYLACRHDKQFFEDLEQMFDLLKSENDKLIWLSLHEEFRIKVLDHWLINTHINTTNTSASLTPKGKRFYLLNKQERKAAVAS